MAKKPPKIPQSVPRVRINPIATAPIMRKGGVHEKSNSAKRQADKRQLRKMIDEAGGGYSAPDAIWGMVRYAA